MRYLIPLMFALVMIGPASALPPQAPCPPQAPPIRQDAYSTARTQAIKDSKPLCVWIGYKCPSSAVQVPGMVHYHASGNTWNGIQGPAVVVAVPGGDGKLYQGEVVAAERCCAVELRAAVERTLSRWERAARPAPVMMPAPMPMMQAPLFMRHVRGWASSRDGNCVG